MKKNCPKIWQKLKKKMAKGRVGVGHPLPIPTELKHCQYTYRHLPTGRSRSDPYFTQHVVRDYKKVALCETHKYYARQSIHCI